MKVLVACEFSGIVREAFASRGHDAWSCDLRPSEYPGKHFQCDIKHVLETALTWDLMIAHPPCTYLCVSGARWFNARKPEQIIQPWMFGHEETKATCLWLQNLPKLQPTCVVEGLKHTIHLEPPGPDRSLNRSRTFTGIAKAMAEQWG